MPEPEADPEPGPSSTADDKVVQLTRVGDNIAIVTLNRPHACNAINAAMAKALGRVVEIVEADPLLQVGILTGSGRKAFSSGADLKELADDSSPASRETPYGGFAGFAYAHRSKVWIAAVNGPALAGGLALMLACDMAVASTDAVFGLPEVKRGMSAGAGGIYRLPRALPRAVALEMIATGNPISAERAHGLGLVNRLVAPEQVLDEALALARSISANAPLSVAWSLEVARRAYDAQEDELRRHADEVMDRLRQTEDFKEGSRAFAEKRQAHWHGR
jgi:enoyl-CoA hydratase/carnithine racemase